MWVNPEIPENTRHSRKYPEIPESKKDTRKYPIVFSDTPTRPEPDLLPGILSNTRPDIEKPYPLGTEGEEKSLLARILKILEEARKRLSRQKSNKKVCESDKKNR